LWFATLAAKTFLETPIGVKTKTIGSNLVFQTTTCNHLPIAPNGCYKQAFFLSSVDNYPFLLFES
jgi:hypothetical protein